MKYKSIKEIKEILDLVNNYPEEYLVEFDKEPIRSTYRSSFKLSIRSIHRYIGYYIHSYYYIICIIG